MSDTEKHDLLALWIEQRLSDEQREEFERRCLVDEDFAGRVKAASAMQFEADSFVDVEVPTWDMQHILPTRQSRLWWRWQGWPIMSMATSMAAILLVALNVQISHQDGATTIRFNGAANDSQAMNLAFDNKIKSFELEQRELMLEYLQGFQQQQQNSNTQLTTYLLDSSRKERREDFAELIKFINQQRADDQLFFARQLNQLQEDLLEEPSDQPWAGPQRLEN